GSAQRVRHERAVSTDSQGGRAAAAHRDAARWRLLGRGQRSGREVELSRPDDARGRAEAGCPLSERRRADRGARAVGLRRDRGRLEAWDGYRRGTASPERLVIRSVPEPSTRVLELLAGTAQIAQTVPIESLDSIRGNPKLEVVSLQGSSSLSYVINVFKTSPPLRDPRVRQAMHYAVDREGIVKSILGGRGTALPGPLWPGWLGDADGVNAYPYDPDRAR